MHVTALWMLFSWPELLCGGFEFKKSIAQKGKEVRRKVPYHSHNIIPQGMCHVRLNYVVTLLS
jgi:hypothetical protein